jgi:hypothetical protein
MSSDKTPTDAADTTGSGIEAVLDDNAKEPVTDEKATIAKEKAAFGSAEAATASMAPSLATGRYDSGEAP